MAKHDPGKTAQDPEHRSTADYYKLKTQAVDDLIQADETNSPEVSAEELKRYGGKAAKGVPESLKICFIKFWFPGAVFFFMVMGLGLWDPLDRIVITGVVMGMVTDLLTDNVVRFFATTKGANDGWIMFSKKRYLTFFFNIFYAIALCAAVFLVAYPALDRLIGLVTGTPGVEHLKAEPVGFGLLYLLCDLLLLGVKHLVAKAIGTAKNKNV